MPSKKNFAGDLSGQEAHPGYTLIVLQTGNSLVP